MHLIFLPRKIIIRVLYGLLLFTITCFLLATGLHQRTQGPLGELTVVIDPGHGGVDGGTADHTGTLEKEINLAIALALRDQLKQSGLNAIMTRETDTDLSPFISGKIGRHRRDLLARVQKARQAQSHILLSIHCDWSEAHHKQGSVVFYNYLSAPSKELALLIQEELNKVQKKPQKAAPGKYYIIRQKGLTGVLIEVGFLSNRGDAALLKSPDYQETLALAISKGVLKYCQQFLPPPGSHPERRQ